MCVYVCTNKVYAEFILQGDAVCVYVCSLHLCNANKAFTHGNCHRRCMHVWECVFGACTRRNAHGDCCEAMHACVGVRAHCDCCEVTHARTYMHT